MDRGWDLPLPRVLYRPNLWMGGEREYVQVLLLGVLLLAYSGLSIASVILALVFWVPGHGALVWIARFDPQAIRIYRQSLKFKSHYLWRATPYRRR